MKADLNSINLRSRNFAALIEVDLPVADLQDGVIYVNCGDSDEFRQAIRCVRESFANCMMRDAWWLKYDVAELPATALTQFGTSLAKKFDCGSNIIMPISTLDRDTKCYLVAKADAPDHLEFISSILSVDAQSIMEICLTPAILNSDPNEILSGLERLDNEEFERLRGDNGNIRAERTRQIPFQGLKCVSPRNAFGADTADLAEKFRKGELTYSEGRRKIEKIANIVKRIKSEDPDEREKAWIEFQTAVAAMSEREMNKILFNFMLSSRPSDTKKNVMAVTDRAAMARNSEYKLKLKKREKGDVSRKFNDTYSYWLYLEGKGDSPIPIKMQKSSFTIYVMSMIEKVTKNGKDAVVDVRNNMDAYMEVNRMLFGVDYKEAAESFKKLDLKIGNISQKYRRGQLGCCYSDIEAALEIAFADTGEDFSPFLIDGHVPLAIPKEKIIIDDVFKSVKIR